MSLSFCFFHFLDPMPIVACPRGKYYDINAKEKIDPLPLSAPLSTPSTASTTTKPPCVDDDATAIALAKTAYGQDITGCTQLQTYCTLSAELAGICKKTCGKCPNVPSPAPTQKYHFYPTYDITNINPWEICQDCPTGWSQPSEFSFQCLECPPGQVADKTRAFNCTECIAKTYQDVSGKKDCLKCRFKSVPRP